MLVNELSLSHFRNFSSEKLQFGEKFNLFIGSNGQGKTNLLEALFLFATGRSFRTPDFRDLLQWNQHEARLEASVVQSEGMDEWKSFLSREEKRIEKNGKEISPRSKRDFDAILFSPEEILLLRESPGERRLYVDQIISRFLPLYRTLVRNYEKVLSHRNALLKDEELEERQKIIRLTDWNHQLMTLGTEMVLHRAAWIQELNQELAAQYRVLAGKEEEAAFVYAPFCGKDSPLEKNMLLRRFSELFDARMKDELIRKISLVGPHRDDFIASLSGSPLSRFGSQGEHRSFILALKVAECELMRKKEGAEPLFLLDDVASELDASRSSAFFEYVCQGPGQIFMTTTDLRQFHVSSWKNACIFDIIDGKARLT